MKTIREWLGIIKSKFKTLTQKLNSAGKYKHLFNHKIVYLLIIVFTIALAVVFSQYPQILTSKAAPPKQSKCSLGEKCCNNDYCKSGLVCYEKHCQTLENICGKELDDPCCPVGAASAKCDGNSKLVCGRNPPLKTYPASWDVRGECIWKDTCAGFTQDCCGNLGDLGRCDIPYSCMNKVVGNGVVERCGYVSTTLSLVKDQVEVDEPVSMYLTTNRSGLKYSFTIDCNNGESPNQIIDQSFVPVMVACSFKEIKEYSITGTIVVDDDISNPEKAYGKVKVVKLSTPTPTPRPSRTPTPRPSRTPTPRPTRTPTPIPTVSYTCNGTCIFATNECYQTGSGTCQSNKYCCKTINSPTPIPPTVVPTKAPNGTACSTVSQCTSGICKTCPGATQGYCRPNGYICPL